tara:strand:+ start:2013 stop:2147 length:135 start_codon:yes stop_codon:yes gene_type:complete
LADQRAGAGRRFKIKTPQDVDFLLISLLINLATAGVGIGVGFSF